MFGLLLGDVKTKHSGGYLFRVPELVPKTRPHVRPSAAAAAGHSSELTLVYPASAHVACVFISW